MPCSGVSPMSGTGSTWQPVWQEPPGLDDNGPTCHPPGELPQEAALTPPAPLPTLPQGLRPMDCVMLHSHDNWELLHGPQTHCCQRDTPARLPGRKHKRSEGLRLGRPWARPRGAVLAALLLMLVLCSSVKSSSYMLRVCTLFRVCHLIKSY